MLTWGRRDDAFPLEDSDLFFVLFRLPIESQTRYKSEDGFVKQSGRRKRKIKPDGRLRHGKRNKNGIS